MNTGKKAEEFVRKYFEMNGIILTKAGKGDLGYDFRNATGDFFVEVKGTAAKDIVKVLFRYFTNTEYEKARSCRKAKQKYEIHLIVDINSSSPVHYVIPGTLLLESGKPEVTWSLPIRKEFQKYKI